LRTSLTSVTLIIPIALSGLVDLPRLLTFGPVSSLALLTTFYASSATLLWLARPVLSRQAISVVAPLAAFLVWAFASLFWSAPTIRGVQNLLVVSGFLVLILLASGKIADKKNRRLIERAFVYAIWLAVSLYAISIFRSGWGAESILGSRSFALFALLGVAWYLASWRYGSQRGLWWAAAITLLIGASLSRMALVVALALFPLSQSSFRSVWGWFRLGLLIAVLVGLSQLALTYVEPVRARFLEASAVEIGGIQINTSGRDVAWPVVLDSWKESPWIGKGAGAAEEVTTRYFPDFGQPHNDYLRVLHDYGVIGLGFWLLTFVNLLGVTFTAWVRSASNGSPDVRLHLAAFLSVVAVVLTMITDNVMIYVFVMAPLGVLVGASLTIRGQEH
jgi:O-antigen ligase